MTISHTPLSMESIQFKQQYLDMLNSTPGYGSVPFDLVEIKEG